MKHYFDVKDSTRLYSVRECVCANLLFLVAPKLVKTTIYFGVSVNIRESCRFIFNKLMDHIHSLLSRVSRDERADE